MEFFCKKNRQKNLKKLKKSVIFLIFFFLAILVLQPIWDMPAKIWGV
jgi:hypothetical protein